MSNQPVTLGHAVDAWLNYKDNLALAPSTIKSKRRTLNHLILTVGDPGYLVEFLTYQHFEDTIADLARGGSVEENIQRKRKSLKPRSGRSAASLEVDRTALTMFASYMRYQGWVSATFFPLIKFTHPNKADTSLATPKRHVEDADFIRLLDAAGAHHARDRIEVAIGLFFGRRVSEVVGIQWKHVDIENSKMSYMNHKKGVWMEGKSFMLPLKTELEIWRDWYIEHFGPIDPEWYVIPARWHVNRLCQYKDVKYAAMNDPSLWPLEPNKPATAESITDDIQKALIKIGWRDVTGEGLHTLRRTHLRKWDDEGHMEIAQEAADHSRRDTTERYTGNLSGKKKYRAQVVDQNPFRVPGYDPPPPAPPVESEPSAVPSNVVDLASWRARKAM